MRFQLGCCFVDAHALVDLVCLVVWRARVGGGVRYG